MFSYEINMLCDSEDCFEICCSTPLRTPDVERAIRDAEVDGWSVERDSQGKVVRVLCRDCTEAKAEALREYFSG